MRLFYKPLLCTAALTTSLTINAASFSDASDYLDIDGEFITFIDFSGDGTAIGQQLNEILSGLQTVHPELAMFPVDFKQVFDQLGFGSMQAVGISSKAIDHGLQANRSVMLTNGNLSGLFAMYGSADAPLNGFTLAERAPADANTVLSGTLDLTPLRDLATELMIQHMGPMGSQIIETQLSTVIPGTNTTVNEIIDAFSGHFQFCMHQSYKDDYTLAYKIWASAANAGSLVEDLRALEASMPIIFSEANGSTIADLSALLGQQDLGLFLKNDPSGALHIYTHADWGPHSDGPKLVDDASFQQVAALLPEKAHWYSYAKGTAGEIESIFTSLEDIPQAAPYLDVGRKAFDLFLGDFMQPAAGATVLTPDAVYTELYSSYSYKQLVTALPAMIGGGLAASLAVPYYMLDQTMCNDFDMAISDEELIRSNLFTIFNAGQLHLLTEDGVSEVSYQQLLEQDTFYNIGEIESVLGESYEDLVITLDTEALSVELPDGRVISSAF